MFFYLLISSSFCTSQCWGKLQEDCVASRFCIWCKHPYNISDTELQFEAECMPGGQYGANDNAAETDPDRKLKSCKYSQSICLVIFLGTFIVIETIIMITCWILHKKKKQKTYSMSSFSDPATQIEHLNQSSDWSYTTVSLHPAYFLYDPESQNQVAYLVFSKSVEMMTLLSGFVETPRQISTDTLLQVMHHIKLIHAHMTFSGRYVRFRDGYLSLTTLIYISSILQQMKCKRSRNHQSSTSCTCSVCYLHKNCLPLAAFMASQGDVILTNLYQEHISHYFSLSYAAQNWTSPTEYLSGRHLSSAVVSFALFLYTECIDAFEVMGAELTRHICSSILCFGAETFNSLFSTIFVSYNRLNHLKADAAAILILIHRWGSLLADSSPSVSLRLECITRMILINTSILLMPASAVVSLIRDCGEAEKLSKDGTASTLFTGYMQTHQQDTPQPAASPHSRNPTDFIRPAPSVRSETGLPETKLFPVSLYLPNTLTEEKDQQSVFSQSVLSSFSFPSLFEKLSNPPAQRDVKRKREFSEWVQTKQNEFLRSGLHITKPFASFDEIQSFKTTIACLDSFYRITDSLTATGIALRENCVKLLRNCKIVWEKVGAVLIDSIAFTAAASDYHLTKRKQGIGEKEPETKSTKSKITLDITIDCSEPEENRIEPLVCFDQLVMMTIHRQDVQRRMEMSDLSEDMERLVKGRKWPRLLLDPPLTPQESLDVISIIGALSEVMEMEGGPYLGDD
ncbi:hypothetical protein BLNAU_112 [Blattamonas nauphoetae]|uniref:Uncharacterized protein n=1 Tax=Blattamonas nauphoetae TaxID=2049346 RepID=A0ABQ9YM41_9EUKA|nr:hypothetical protein BLNAU_112 [Blattamonas nauphoetae]